MGKPEIECALCAKLYPVINLMLYLSQQAVDNVPHNAARLANRQTPITHALALRKHIGNLVIRSCLLWAVVYEETWK